MERAYCDVFKSLAECSHFRVRDKSKKPSYPFYQADGQNLVIRNPATPFRQA